MVLKLLVARLQNCLVYSGVVLLLVEQNDAGCSTCCKYIHYLTFGGLCFSLLAIFYTSSHFLIIFLKFLIASKHCTKLTMIYCISKHFIDYQTLF